MVTRISVFFSINNMYKPYKFQCVAVAWEQYEQDVVSYLSQQLNSDDLVQDILQETFLKAMRAGQQSCELDHPKAWLLKVAHNILSNYFRSQKKDIELDEEMIDSPAAVRLPVDELDQCIARNLPSLSDEDRDILEYCTLNGTRQKDYAQLHSLSVDAVKSRLKRAKQRLREQLVQQCQVNYDEQNKVCCHKPKI